MDEAYRKRLLSELEALKQCVEQSNEGDQAWEDELDARIDSLETVMDDRPNAAEALVGHLRDEVLEWEVEHPKLAALVHRISSALEGVGL